MLAANRLCEEADQAFSENEEMKIQARTLINAAESGYQTMQEQAQSQFMEMSMNHRQQIPPRDEPRATTANFVRDAEAPCRN